MRRILNVICAITVLSGVSAVYADEIIVDHAGSGDFLTIQTAIDDPGTDTGDIITVLSGTYVENINLSGKAITLRSSNPTDPNVVAITIIDGNDISSVITCSSGEGPNTIIEGFWVTNGLTNSGAGMYNQGSSPTVRYCVFDDNHANASGGGMANLFDSAPVISHCTFSNNTAVSQGGGMYNYSNSAPIVSDCTFSGNTAGADGGAMANNTSSPMVSGCTFSNNTADAQGGGMHNIYSSSPMVSDCTFNGNTANTSGGMHNYESSPTVFRCTFTLNTALTGGGGGMLNSKSSSMPTITHCTFSNNTTGGNGGGLHNTAKASPTVSYCTFDNNTATYYGGGMYSQEFSSTVEHCVFSGNTSDDRGGGMYNYYHSSPTVTHCTFSRNTSPYDDGDGIYNYYYSSPSVRNCILWGNGETSNGDEIYNHNNSDPNFMYCDIEDSGGSAAWNSSLGNDDGGNIDVDPLFTDVIDLRLTEGSLCIDAGDSTDAVQNPGMLDRNGNPRAIDDPDTPNTGISVDVPALGTAYAVDMGAYEYQPCIPVKTGDLNCDNEVDMLDLAILAANWLQ